MITSDNIKFYPKSHRYKREDTGEWIPSVTTIGGMLNKPYLTEWAAREAATAAIMGMIETDEIPTDQSIVASIKSAQAAPRNQRDHGRKVGSAVHERIHCHFDADRMPDPDVEDGGIEADLAYEAFEQWLAETDIAEVLLVEQIVVHPDGLYVGTPDLLWSDSVGLVTLTDFKSSNQSEANPLALYPEYVLQLCAYKMGIELSPEFKHGRVDRIMGVALGKNGNLEQWSMTEGVDSDALREAEGLFVSLADSYRPYRNIDNLTSQMNRSRKKQIEEAASV